MLGPSFIRVTVKAMWRREHGKIIVYTFPFDLLGDPGNAEHVRGTVTDVVTVLAQ